MNETPKDAAMLKKAREDAGLTVREVATLTGMSESSIRQAERRGVRNVRVSRVVRLCRALNVNIDALTVR